MGSANHVSGFFKVTLVCFGLAGVLAVGCGGDDGDTGGTATGSGTGSGTGTATGTGTGTESGTGTGSGTGSGTAAGTGSGTGSGTPGGMGACDPDPNEPCEVCAAQECATETDACCVEMGCLDLVRCALETGCSADPNPLACYMPDTCQTEVDNAGGPLGSGTTAAQTLGECTVNAAEAASGGPCQQCNEQINGM